MILISSQSIGIVWFKLLFISILLQGVVADTSSGTLAKRGLPTLVLTKSTSVITSYSSGETSFVSNITATSYSNSTSHSSSATFAPTIPSSAENKYIYHAKHAGGTVFIAVGSCLAFILFVLVVVWTLFGIGAWHSARKEYKLKEMEDKYQYDPFFFSNTNESSDYSDSDEKSDISEKVLKNKSSRVSLYSLGSTSVLNLLNQGKSGVERNNEPLVGNSANRRSMFISPTELLQNEANRTGLWVNDKESSSNLFDSPASTQLEHSYAQFINNGESLGVEKPNIYYHQNNSGSTADLLLSSKPILSPDDSPSSFGTNGTNDSNARRKKNYRPPSVHLDELLDEGQN